MQLGIGREKRVWVKFRNLIFSGCISVLSSFIVLHKCSGVPKFGGGLRVWGMLRPKLVNITKVSDKHHLDQIHDKLTLSKEKCSLSL